MLASFGTRRTLQSHPRVSSHTPRSLPALPKSAKVGKITVAAGKSLAVARIRRHDHVTAARIILVVSAAAKDHLGCRKPHLSGAAALASAKIILTTANDVLAATKLIYYPVSGQAAQMILGAGHHVYFACRQDHLRGSPRST